MTGDSGPEPGATNRVPRFIRLERNLCALGYFTASSRRVRYFPRKVVACPRVIDGQTIETVSEIIPSATYGLPTTADQDQYFAFQKIITDIQRRQGVVRNPVVFPSAEILRLLGKRVNAGKNYEDLTHWLRRMAATTIRSNGTVYLAGRKEWVHDTVRVFEQVVPLGAPLPGGQIAERNHVWLSEWQLENINHGHLIPMDWDCYRRLRNPIAKTIVPILQIWLWMSREAGVIEKSYEELCGLLNLRMYAHGSKIAEKLMPSLRELTLLGYLENWELLRQGLSDYTFRFFHGTRFRQAAQGPLDA